MRHRSAVLTSAVIVILAGCTAQSTALPTNTSTPSTSSTSRQSTSVALAPASVSTQPAVVVEAAPTTASPTVSASASSAATPPTPELTTTTQTEVTTSVLSDASRSAVALFVAQSLVTAFAHGDWEAARTISPQSPEWSDAKYAKGFAGLNEAFLTSSDSLIWGPTGGHAGRVELWLVEVAHETRATTARTSVYCVHWTFVEETQTLLRVAGRTIKSVAGTLDPSAQANDALVACDHFDEQSAVPAATQPPMQTDSATTPTYPTSTHPAPTHPTPSYYPPVTTSPDLSGWTRITFQASTYLCQSTGDLGNFDCAHYNGGNAPPTRLYRPDIRCTERSSNSFECTTDSYYPSDLDGFTVSSIDSSRVLCRAYQCWLWPMNQRPHMSGPPDYECEIDGPCKSYG